MSRRLVLAVLAALALVTSISAGTAAADPYGSPNPGLYPDSKDHWFCFDASVPASERPRISASMSYLDDRTNMYDVYTASCGTSTDVVWVYGSPIIVDGYSYYGYTTCAVWVYEPWGVCDQFWVLVDQPLHFARTVACGSSGTVYDLNLITTIRHELGHTAGLSHAAYTGPPCDYQPGGNDAMTSDFYAFVTYDYVDYNGHHRDHINAFFP